MKDKGLRTKDLLVSSMRIKDLLLMKDEGYRMKDIVASLSFQS